MIREAIQQDRASLARHWVDFRTILRRFKGIERQISLEDAQEEVDYLINNGFPIYVAEVNGEVVG